MPLHHTIKTGGGHSHKTMEKPPMWTDRRYTKLGLCNCRGTKKKYLKYPFLYRFLANIRGLALRVIVFFLQICLIVSNICLFRLMLRVPL